MEGRARRLIGWALKAVLASTAAMLAAALGGDGPRAQAGSAAPPVVDCETRIQLIGDATPGPRSIKIGPVVFSALKQWRKVEPSGLRPRGKRWTPVKAPFLIRSEGPQATVMVDGAIRPRARVSVGLDKGGAAAGPAVTLTPCQTRRHRWTAFLAGFQVKGPTCMRLSVQVEGQLAPIGPRKVAIGKHSCRGK